MNFQNKLQRSNSKPSQNEIEQKNTPKNLIISSRNSSQPKMQSSQKIIQNLEKQKKQKQNVFSIEFKATKTNNRIKMTAYPDRKLIIKTEYGSQTGKTLDITRLSSIAYFFNENNDIIIENQQKDTFILQNSSNVEYYIKQLADAAKIPLKQMNHSFELKDSQGRTITYYLEYIGQEGVKQKIDGVKTSDKLIKHLEFNLTTQKINQITNDTEDNLQNNDFQIQIDQTPEQDLQDKNIDLSQKNEKQTSQQSNPLKINLNFNEDDNQDQNQYDVIQDEAYLPIDLSHLKQDPHKYMQILDNLIEFSRVSNIEVFFVLNFIDSYKNHNIIKCNIYSQNMLKIVKQIDQDNEIINEEVQEIQKLQLSSENGLNLSETQLYILLCIIANVQLQINFQFEDFEHNRFKIEKKYQINKDEKIFTYEQNLYKLQAGDFIEIGPLDSLLKFQLKTQKNELFTINDYTNKHALQFNSEQFFEIKQKINYIIYPVKIEDENLVNANQDGDIEEPDNLYSEPDTSDDEQQMIKQEKTYIQIEEESKRDEKSQKKTQLFDILNLQFDKYKIKNFMQLNVKQTETKKKQNTDFLDGKKIYVANPDEIQSKLLFKTVNEDVVTMVSDKKDRCIDIYIKTKQEMEQKKQNKKEKQQKKQEKLKGAANLRSIINKNLRSKFSAVINNVQEKEKDKITIFKMNFYHYESGEFKFLEENQQLCIIPKYEKQLKQIKDFILKTGIVFKEFIEFKINYDKEENFNSPIASGLVDSQIQQIFQQKQRQSRQSRHGSTFKNKLQFQPQNQRQSQNLLIKSRDNTPQNSVRAPLKSNFQNTSRLSSNKVLEEVTPLKGMTPTSKQKLLGGEQLSQKLIFKKLLKTQKSIAFGVDRTPSNRNNGKTPLNRGSNINNKRHTFNNFTDQYSKQTLQSSNNINNTSNQSIEQYEDDQQNMIFFWLVLDYQNPGKVLLIKNSLKNYQQNNNNVILSDMLHDEDQEDDEVEDLTSQNQTKSDKIMNITFFSYIQQQKGQGGDLIVFDQNKNLFKVKNKEKSIEKLQVISNSIGIYFEQVQTQAFFNEKDSGELKLLVENYQSKTIDIIHKNKVIDQIQGLLKYDINKQKFETQSGKYYILHEIQAKNTFKRIYDLCQLAGVNIITNLEYKQEGNKYSAVIDQQNEILEKIITPINGQQLPYADDDPQLYIITNELDQTVKGNIVLQIYESLNWTNIPFITSLNFYTIDGESVIFHLDQRNGVLLKKTYKKQDVNFKHYFYDKKLFNINSKESLITLKEKQQHKEYNYIGLFTQKVKSQDFSKAVTEEELIPQKVFSFSFKFTHLTNKEETPYICIAKGRNVFEDDIKEDIIKNKQGIISLGGLECQQSLHIIKNDVISCLMDFKNKKIQFYNPRNDKKIVIDLNYSYKLALKKNNGQNDIYPTLVKDGFQIGLIFKNKKDQVKYIGCYEVSSENQIVQQILDLKYIRFEKFNKGLVKLIDNKKHEIILKEIQNNVNVMQMLKNMLEPANIDLIIMQEYTKAAKRVGQLEYKDTQELVIYSDFKEKLLNIENQLNDKQNKHNKKHLEEEEEKIFKKYERMLLEKQQKDADKCQDFTFNNQLKHQNIDVSINNGITQVSSKISLDIFKFAVFDIQIQSQQTYTFEFEIENISKGLIGIGLCNKQHFSHHNFTINKKSLGSNCYLAFSNGTQYYSINTKKKQKDNKEQKSKEYIPQIEQEINSNIKLEVKEEEIKGKKEDKDTIKDQKKKPSKQKKITKKQQLEKIKKDKQEKEQEIQENTHENTHEDYIFTEGDTIILQYLKGSNEIIIQKKQSSLIGKNMEQLKIPIVDVQNLDSSNLYPCIMTQGKDDKVTFKKVTNVKKNFMSSSRKQNTEELNNPIITADTANDLEYSIASIDNNQQNDRLLVQSAKQVAIFQPNLLKNKKYNFSFHIKNLNPDGNLGIGICQKQSVQHQHYRVKTHQENNVYLLYQNGQIEVQQDKQQDTLHTEPIQTQTFEQIFSHQNLNSKREKKSKFQQNYQNQKNLKNQKNKNPLKLKKSEQFILKKGDIINCEVTPENITFTKKKDTLMGKIRGQTISKTIIINNNYDNLEEDLHPCVALSSEDDEIEFGTQQQITNSVNSDNWFQYFLIGGRSPVAPLIFLGTILAGINEVVLYWVNFYLNIDEYDKIEKGAMLRDMTFFLLLFSPVVQVFAWMLIIGQVKQKLPQNRHHFQDEEDAVKNIVNPVEQAKVQIKILINNNYYLVKWILESFIMSIILSLLVQIKTGPYVLHLYIMKKKKIVLTPLLSEKMLAQAQLGDDDSGAASQQESLIPQQATLDYNLKVNWATYFFHSDVETYLGMCDTIQTLLQSAPMVVVQYITYQMTDNWNVGTIIAFTQSILQTIVEIIKLFNIIFKDKVELFYLLDNKEENDEIFKLKRNIKISNFEELISLAHLKDDSYADIKSIEINLTNNKKFRKLIPEVLEVIQDKFKSCGLILERFITDVSSCGIYKKKRMEKCTSFKFQVNKLTVEKVKQQKFEHDKFFYSFDEQEYLFHFPNNDQRIQKINQREKELKFKYDDNFRNIILQKFTQYNKKPASIIVDSNFIMDLKTFRLIQYLGTEQLVQEQCKMLKYDGKLKDGFMDETLENLELLWKQKLKEYRLYGDMGEDKDFAYLLKLNFHLDLMGNMNFELLQVNNQFQNIKYLDLFVEIQEIQSTELIHFKKVEAGIYKMLKQKGNLQHLSIQFGHKSKKHTKSISQTQQELDLYIDLKKHLEKLDFTDVQIESNVDNIENQITTDHIQQFFQDIYQKYYKPIKKHNIAGDLSKKMLSFANLSEQDQKQEILYPTQILEHFELYIVYNNFPQASTIEFSKPQMHEQLQLDGKNQISYYVHEKIEEDKNDDYDQEEEPQQIQIKLEDQDKENKSQNNEQNEQDDEEEIIEKIEEKYKLAILQPHLQQGKMHNFFANLLQLSVQKNMCIGVCHKKLQNQYNTETLIFDNPEDINDAYFLTSEGIAASNYSISKVQEQATLESNQNIDVKDIPLSNNKLMKQSGELSNLGQIKKANILENKYNNLFAMNNPGALPELSKTPQLGQAVSSQGNIRQSGSQRNISIPVSAAKKQRNNQKKTSIIGLKRPSKSVITSQSVIQDTIQQRDIFKHIPQPLYSKYPQNLHNLMQQIQNKDKTCLEMKTDVNLGKPGIMKMGFLPYEIKYGNDYIFSFKIIKKYKIEKDITPKNALLKDIISYKQTDAIVSGNNLKIHLEQSKEESGSNSDSYGDFKSELSDASDEEYVPFAIGICDKYMAVEQFQLDVNAHEDKVKEDYNYQEKLENEEIILEEEEQNGDQDNEDNNLIVNDDDIENLKEKSIKDKKQYKNKFCMIGDNLILSEQKNNSLKGHISEEFEIDQDDEIVCQVVYNIEEKQSSITFINTRRPTQKITQIINYDSNKSYHPCCGLADTDYQIEFKYFQEIKFNMEQGHSIYCEIDPDQKDPNSTLIKYTNKNDSNVEPISIRISEPIENLHFCVLIKAPNDSIEIQEEEEDQFKIVLPEILENNKELKHFKFVYGEIQSSNSDKINQEKQQLENDIQKLKDDLKKLLLGSTKLSKKQIEQKKKMLEQQLTGKEQIKGKKEKQLQKEQEQQEKLKEQVQDQQKDNSEELKLQIKTANQKIEELQEDVNKIAEEKDQEIIEQSRLVTEKELLLEKNSKSLKEQKIQIKDLERKMKIQQEELEELRQQKEKMKQTAFVPQKQDSEEMQLIEKVFAEPKSKNQWKYNERQQVQGHETLFKLEIVELEIFKNIKINLKKINEQPNLQLQQIQFKSDTDCQYYITGFTISIIFMNMTQQEIRDLEEQQKKQQGGFLCNTGGNLPDQFGTQKKLDYKQGKIQIGVPLELQPDGNIKQIVLQISMNKVYHDYDGHTEVSIRTLALEIPQQDNIPENLGNIIQSEYLVDDYNKITKDKIQYKWDVQD